VSLCLCDSHFMPPLPCPLPHKWVRGNNTP
jgi:hypothetical protein